MVDFFHCQAIVPAGNVYSPYAVFLIICNRSYCSDKLYTSCLCFCGLTVQQKKEKKEKLR